MNSLQEYAIGTPGNPWGEKEKTQWLALQDVHRSYQVEVVEKINSIAESFSALLVTDQYGRLSYNQLNSDQLSSAQLSDAQDEFPLYAFKTKNWQSSLPAVLVTGGVHGYETSGVHGALRFFETELANFDQQFNFVIAPCVSPWGYETINRWNPIAVDPNRSFHSDSPAQEASLLMSHLNKLGYRFFAHVDLHETTDTDNSEFRPALAARDAIYQKAWDIPDGFYCVGDTLKPAPEFQAAIINSVKKVTHIAEADENNKLIGETIEQHGVINYPTKELGLCAGVTDAPFVTTTEVYPDSPRVDDNNCTQAQVAAITGALNFLRTL